MNLKANVSGKWHIYNNSIDFYDLHFKLYP